MINANPNDRALVVNLLAESFDDNQSVNYIVKQDSKRVQRIRVLMDYSFEICSLFGAIYLSNDKKACALIVFPDQKRTTLKSILMDLKLIFFCVGLGGIQKTLRREGLIKKIQTKEKMYYLWFISVDKSNQHSGIGSKLLQEIIEDGNSKNLPIYLETSTLKNLPWYERFGFKIYHELKLSYALFFLKRDAGKL
jgi:ribosomal protein S18 acetylase RimI-like enzyme